MSEEREIQERSILMVYFLTFITMGIYGIYWSVSTKEDLNSLGGQIPTAWLLLFPPTAIYWTYKYSEAYACQLRKTNDPVLWFFIYICASPVMPAFVQSGLNKLRVPSEQGEAPSSSQAA